MSRGDWLISTEGLQALLGCPDVLIFDCTTRLLPDDRTIYRAEPSWQDFQGGHIPGAQFIDVQKDLSDCSHRYKFMLPSAEQFGFSMSRLGLRPGMKVVLYSTGDPWWATRVWWLMRVFGFFDAVVLDGGLRKWTSENRSREAGDGRLVQAGAFHARKNSGMVAHKTDVLSGIGDERVCIINARLATCFRGEDGNQYGRPGRIVGSCNVPAAELVDPKTGCFLGDELLREKFVHLDAHDKQLIVYCGHGVAASADVFVLTMLGYPDVRLYDGSLSEWASSTDLPMEVG